MASAPAAVDQSVHRLARRGEVGVLRVLVVPRAPDVVLVHGQRVLVGKQRQACQELDPGVRDGSIGAQGAQLLHEREVLLERLHRQLEGGEGGDAVLLAVGGCEANERARAWVGAVGGQGKYSPKDCIPKIAFHRLHPPDCIP